MLLQLGVGGTLGEGNQGQERKPNSSALVNKSLVDSTQVESPEQCQEDKPATWGALPSTARSETVPTDAVIGSSSHPQGQQVGDKVPSMPSAAF